MSADSGSEMLDYTDSEEERKREEQRAIEEKKRVDKCIFFFQKKPQEHTLVWPCREGSGAGRLSYRKQRKKM